MAKSFTCGLASALIFSLGFAAPLHVTVGHDHERLDSLFAQSELAEPVAVGAHHHHHGDGGHSHSHPHSHDAPGQTPAEQAPNDAPGDGNSHSHSVFDHSGFTNAIQKVKVLPYGLTVCSVRIQVADHSLRLQEVLTDGIAPFESAPTLPDRRGPPALA